MNFTGMQIKGNPVQGENPRKAFGDIFGTQD
jgi:hypothetical protein